MKILGIETSCDETAAAIVEDGRKILANVVASSREIHDKTGGVIPEVAAREQVKCMIPVINRVQSSKFKVQSVDAIAVTVGPGLNGSLLVGVETAKTISMVLNKPLIPINHIFAHIYANWLDAEKDPVFPAVALVVSGGHTELFLMKSHKELQWLGGTLDDASGEAFDKTARLLGLGYPGGPAISAAAEKFEIRNSKFEIRLPRPMIDSGDLNFSFSGLKTAVLREVNRLKNSYYNDVYHRSNSNEVLIPEPSVYQIAYEIQESITDVLVKKTIDAAMQYNVKSILLGGGVAANKRLKEKFLISNSQFSINIPKPEFCTDNAAYIASFAYFHNNPVSWSEVQAEPNLEVEVS